MTTGGLNHLARLADQAGQMVNRVIDAIVAVLIALMVLDVGIGVVFRYLLNNPLSWTEELARYLMIWAAALAIAAAVFRREHIGFTLLIDMVPPTARRVFILVFDLIILIFFAVLFIFGLKFFITGLAQNTMSLGVTMAVAYAAVPVAASIAIVQTLFLAIRDVFDPTHLQVGTETTQ